MTDTARLSRKLALSSCKSQVLCELLSLVPQINFEDSLLVSAAFRGLGFSLWPLGHEPGQLALA